LDRYVGKMKKLSVFLDCSNGSCNSNISTLSKIYRYIESNEHRIVNNYSKADYVIINTCGFDEIHESKTAELFRLYSRYKFKVISIGCLNKINPSLLDKQIKDIIKLDNLNNLDKYFYKKVRFEQMNEEYIETSLQKKLNVQERDISKYYEFILKKVLGPIFKNKVLFKKIYDEFYFKNRFFVEICQGCLGNCSYCIIKKARGKLKSRPQIDILKDIKKTYQPGKTLSLVADDCGAYGIDIKDSFPNLLMSIAKEYPKIVIDITDLNPNWLIKYEEQFYNLFKKIKIHSINITLQSGSNKVIRNMNRRYDVTNVLSIIKKLRKISSSTFFWTHAMVGFPKETWLDFFKTIKAMWRFDYFILFAYSERKGTESVDFSNKNSNIIILIRYCILKFFQHFYTLIKVLFS